jgi:hypothetical protein
MDVHLMSILRRSWVHFASKQAASKRAVWAFLSLALNFLHAIVAIK